MHVHAREHAPPSLICCRTTSHDTLQFLHNVFVLWHTGVLYGWCDLVRLCIHGIAAGFFHIFRKPVVADDAPKKHIYIYYTILYDLLNLQYMNVYTIGT